MRGAALIPLSFLFSEHEPGKQIAPRMTIDRIGARRGDVASTLSATTMP